MAGRSRRRARRPRHRPLWVPTTLSLLLTWCLLLPDQGRASSACACARAARRGTVLSRATTTGLSRGAARVQLASVACPVRPCLLRTPRSSSCVIGSPCSSGKSRNRCCPGPTGRSWPRWPGADPRPGRPAAPDHLPAHPAALVRPPRAAALDPNAGRAPELPKSLLENWPAGGGGRIGMFWDVAACR
jgi:hypothetical protein